MIYFYDIYKYLFILTGLLQLLYNAADVILAAKWAGGTALAAVGSNGSLICTQGVIAGTNRYVIGE